jgi:hypothetical protein
MQLWIISERELFEEIIEILDGQTCLSNNCAKRAAVELLMIRDNQLCKRIITAKDHVASLLAPEKETCG